MILLCRKRSSVCLWRHHARKAKTLRRLWQVVFLGMRIKWIHIGMLPPASNIHLQNYIYNLYEHVKQMIPIKTFIWYCYWQGFFSIPKRLIRIFMLFRCPRVEDIFDGRFYSCFNVPPLQPKRIVPFRAKCSCVWRGCIWIARMDLLGTEQQWTCVFLKVWKNHVRILLPLYIHVLRMKIIQMN